MSDSFQYNADDILPCITGSILSIYQIINDIPITSMIFYNLVNICLVELRGNSYENNEEVILDWIFCA